MNERHAIGWHSLACAPKLATRGVILSERIPPGGWCTYGMAAERHDGLVSRASGGLRESTGIQGWERTLPSATCPSGVSKCKLSYPQETQPEVAEGHFSSSSHRRRRRVEGGPRESRHYLPAEGKRT